MHLLCQSYVWLEGLLHLQLCLSFSMRAAYSIVCTPTMPTGSAAHADITTEEIRILLYHCQKYMFQYCWKY